MSQMEVSRFTHKFLENNLLHRKLDIYYNYTISFIQFIIRLQISILSKSEGIASIFERFVNNTECSFKGNINSKLSNGVSNFAALYQRLESSNTKLKDATNQLVIKINQRILDVNTNKSYSEFGDIMADTTDIGVLTNKFDTIAKQYIAFTNVANEYIDLICKQLHSVKTVNKYKYYLVDSENVYNMIYDHSARITYDLEYLSSITTILELSFKNIINIENKLPIKKSEKYRKFATINKQLLHRYTNLTKILTKGFIPVELDRHLLTSERNLVIDILKKMKKDTMNGMYPQKAYNTKKKLKIENLPTDKCSNFTQCIMDYNMVFSKLYSPKEYTLKEICTGLFYGGKKTNLPNLYGERLFEYMEKAHNMCFIVLDKGYTTEQVIVNNYNNVFSKTYDIISFMTLNRGNLTSDALHFQYNRLRQLSQDEETLDDYGKNVLNSKGKPINIVRGMDTNNNTFLPVEFKKIGHKTLLTGGGIRFNTSIQNPNYFVILAYIDDKHYQVMTDLTGTVKFSDFTDIPNFDRILNMIESSYGLHSGVEISTYNNENVTTLIKANTAINKLNNSYIDCRGEFDVHVLQSAPHKDIASLQTDIRLLDADIRKECEEKKFSDISNILDCSPDYSVKENEIKEESEKINNEINKKYASTDTVINQYNRILASKLGELPDNAVPNFAIKTQMKPENYLDYCISTSIILYDSLVAKREKAEASNDASSITTIDRFLDTIKDI